MQFSSTRYGRYCTNAVVAANNEIARYGRLGQIKRAQEIFDEMSDKSIVSWNAIISGYFQSKQPREAQRLFDIMPERNTSSWNSLISGYVKNKMIKEARKVFDNMPERNVVSWTSMVRGYVQEGIISEAESLFQQMPERNIISWTVMLGGLIRACRVDDARGLFDSMPEKDVVAWTNMVAGYCQEGRMSEARELFDSMPCRNVISWTTMLTGYAQNLQVDIARELFEVMPEKNEVSWTAMLTAYTRCGRIDEAFDLFNRMPDKSVVACNAMILGFGQNGKLAEAREIFDRMRNNDDGTWSAMIKGYEKNGFEMEALNLFSLMLRARVQANYSSLISVLSVCSSLAILSQGRQIHGKVVKSEFASDVFVASALVTLYVKCGELGKARCLFDRFAPKDVVMWNSMITGYAQHGLGDDALHVFYEMCSAGMVPDEVTFIGVLSACSYTGKVDDGMKIFESMRFNYSVEPTAEHYACVVDLLGRAGHVHKALDMIEKMPVEADAVVWGAFLGACKMHMNEELAEIAAKKLVQLEPNNAGPYVLLSNIYASKKRWKEVEELRKCMRIRNVNKFPGCSWIEIEKKVHMFTGGDSERHPEHKIIARMLDKLEGMLRDAGYSPDSSFVVHDVDEEEKVLNLGHHSEKLAVAYGLLKVPEGMPIRVMKNLRVCGDCHSAIKLISKITKREIILRDANRFHHFKDGLCSCRDYW
ncbi:Pentatricopeptide repeat-containing protein [Thalictrum thalictroides]|uniref:Pentatricopeptide repeat-containing protein n=1 Tax=Thalictrum thalictroides TaxID=46969 RepID=A0A7J6X8W7_THATH|nr:Pentatricopeptide repeat-containing protein [Thalictrum thalictroides]